jgi:hypothetical protein
LGADAVRGNLGLFGFRILHNYRLKTLDIGKN